MVFPAPSRHHVTPRMAALGTVAAIAAFCRVKGREGRGSPNRGDVMTRTSFLLLCGALLTAVTAPAFAGQEATPSATPAQDSLTRAALLAAAREQKGQEL